MNAQAKKFLSSHNKEKLTLLFILSSQEDPVREGGDELRNIFKWGSNLNISESVAPMKVKKTVKAKIVYLTKIKRQLLEEEYENLQRFLHGEDVELYSANKQQAKRFYKKIKPDREYPLSIRKDLLKIERGEGVEYG